MSCDRCKDIHEAQKSGKTQKQCQCSCHDNYIGTTSITGATTTTPWLINLDGNGGASTCNFNNAQIDPTSGAQDVTLNYGQCSCCGGYHG